MEEGTRFLSFFFYGCIMGVFPKTERTVFFHSQPVETCSQSSVQVLES